MAALDYLSPASGVGYDVPYVLPSQKVCGRVCSTWAGVVTALPLPLMIGNQQQ